MTLAQRRAGKKLTSTGQLHRYRLTGVKLTFPCEKPAPNVHMKQCKSRK